MFVAYTFLQLGYPHFSNWAAPSLQGELPAGVSEKEASPGSVDVHHLPTMLW